MLLYTSTEQQPQSALRRLRRLRTIPYPLILSLLQILFHVTEIIELANPENAKLNNTHQVLFSLEVSLLTLK